MESLNTVDMHYLISMTLILVLFALFYLVAAHNHKKTLNKIDQALKFQEQISENIFLSLNELRRSNRFLAELAGIEPLPYNTELTFGKSTASAQNASDANYNLNKLYVGNIDYAVTEHELADLFSRYGQVEFVNIPVNRYTGRARGFGFVTFAKREEAERAMALNGSDLKGRQIQVNFAKERDNAQ